MATVMAFALGMAACKDETPFPDKDELVQISGLLKIRTPPDDSTNRFSKSLAAATLGAKLFSDPSLSGCGFVSCATCHPSPGFAASAAKSVGCSGAPTHRNTPTVLNQVFRRWFYWDGRKDSLWAHAVLPLSRDVEMNQNAAGLRTALQATYAQEYKALFCRPPDDCREPKDEADDELLFANTGKALAAYMRTLVQVDAPFDVQLESFLAAVKAGTEQGDPLYGPLKVFVRRGRCTLCHRGPMLADDGFHNLGVAEMAEPDPGQEAGFDLLTADPYNGGGRLSDDIPSGQAKLNSREAPIAGGFKTPSLRNVGLTAPYMHTGAYDSLEQVIDFYDRGGDAKGTFVGERAETIVPLNLTPDEKLKLKGLLESLTGQNLP